MEINYRRDLYKLLDEYQLPRVVAEIGVAEGLFSRDMLNWGLDHLYCVDNYDHIPKVTGDGNNSQEWHIDNMRKAHALLRPWTEAGKVTWLRGYSVKMAQQVPVERLGILYLDGDHSHKGVLNDILTWLPKLVEGGIVAGHDYLNASYGVRQAVEEFCRGEDMYEIHLIPEDKEEDAGFWFQV